MATVETKRLFVGIYPSREVVERLLDARQQIARHTTPGSVRWTLPEQIHLTLNFLGSIEASRITEFEDALQSVSCQCAPHPLRVMGMGCFPTLERPGIIWAGLTGELERIKKLKQLLDPTLESLGCVPDARPFHPHLTIGRVNKLNSRDRQSLRQAISGFDKADFGECHARQFDLVESVLSAAGAVYSVVKSFPLTGE